MIFPLRQDQGNNSHYRKYRMWKDHVIKSDPSFYDVTSGSITIDGIDIREMSQEKFEKKSDMYHKKECFFQERSHLT